jgi:hypothetical protein
MFAINSLGMSDGMELSLQQTMRLSHLAPPLQSLTVSEWVRNRIGENQLGSRFSPSGALSARATSSRDNQRLRGGGALLRFRCFERVGRKAPGPEHDTVTPAGDQCDETPVE